MRFPGLWLALGMLGALGAGALGGWLARGPSSELRAADALAPAAAADPVLADAIRELAREVQRLRADALRAPVEAREPAASRESVPSAASAADAQALEALMLRVASALEQGNGLAAATAFEGELRMRPLGSQDPGRAAALQEAARADYDVALEAHEFWSYQRLLDRYGRPDRITADGPTCTFVYELGEGRELGFKLYSGIVIDVWL